MYFFFFLNDSATTEIYTLSLHDALPIWSARAAQSARGRVLAPPRPGFGQACASRYWRSSSRWMRARLPQSRRPRSEEHTSELQSQSNLVCRLLLEKKKKKNKINQTTLIN